MTLTSGEMEGRSRHRRSAPKTAANSFISVATRLSMLRTIEPTVVSFPSTPMKLSPCAENARPDRFAPKGALQFSYSSAYAPEQKQHCASFCSILTTIVRFGRTVKLNLPTRHQGHSG